MTNEIGGPLSKTEGELMVIRGKNGLARLGSVIILTMAGTIGSAAAQNQAARPVTSSMCLDAAARQTLTKDVTVSIVKAVGALPNTRSSTPDIESTILYVLGQRSLCPGVAREALASFKTGTPQFLEAVGRIRTSLIDARARTAGVVSTPGGAGLSTFTAPIVGLGGGSANYSR